MPSSPSAWRARLCSRSTRRELFALSVLVSCVALAYLPSLHGGFLNLDDPWLIQENPVFRRPTWGALVSIWTDLSSAARLSLGAEYLPVRDTSVWLDARCDGLSPFAMRAVSWCCYLVALLFLRGALRRALGARLTVELSVLVFALHPVHVESVAWLAGRKDVLSLLFVAWALFVHGGQSRWRPLCVPVLLVCAHFAKAQSVIAGGLLVAHDLLARRRLQASVYVPVLVVAALAAWLHMRVGQSVKMTTRLAGGSHLNALLTMGEVALRYLRHTFWPTRLSVLYDVPTRTHLTLRCALGYGLLSLWLAVGLFAWRRARALPLAAWLWFVVPLLPVSQVIFPLQNRMADRYLLFSVLSGGLLLGCGIEGTSGQVRRVSLCGAALLAFGLGALTFQQSRLFADSALLFGDATRKTQLSALAPYQWAIALEAKPDTIGAELAYREVLRRTVRATEPGRRATNNLARAYARDGRLDDASDVLLRGRLLWPQDPKIIYNLAVVTARRGQRAEAEALLAELSHRFPNFRPGESSAADFYSAP